MFLVLQLKCNGYVRDLAQLQAQIAEYQPLQETHLKPIQQIKSNKYKIYRKDITEKQRASGGVLLLIKASKHSEEIKINNNLEAIAIKMHYPETITICNLYLLHYHSNQLKINWIIQYNNDQNHVL